jgi:hypothetical protein
MLNCFFSDGRAPLTAIRGIPLPKMLGKLRRTGILWKNQLNPMNLRTRRLLKGLLLAFCCWHAGFLVVSIIPKPLAQRDHGNPALDLYCLVLSGREEWSVFETIPLQHSMDVWLEREDETGAGATVGCVLPGFKPYPIPEKSRYYMLLYKLMFFLDDAPYRDAYLRKLARLLAARRGPGVDGKWSLVTAAGYTRNLYHIRRDGQISMLVPRTFDLATPGGGSP